ncbi:MAG: molecular chaperone TorD family protein [Bacillus sp. (in: Bacteria)]|nr:molecular chaperone TorD family protein [Bacillus sp. (in: firmicutes)]
MNTQIDQKQGISRIFYILADLYKYPDLDIWEDITCNRLLNEIKEHATRLHIPDSLIEITDLPIELKQMQEIYVESIGGTAVPIESIYKQWTTDRTCNLPFAKSKGYLLGDSALHIRFILEEFDIEIPKEYKNKPDHLAILLELLGYFIENAEAAFTSQFLVDHFDWLDEFAARLEALPGNQFYLQVTRLLQQILHSLKSNYRF